MRNKCKKTQHTSYYLRRPNQIKDSINGVVIIVAAFEVNSSVTNNIGKALKSKKTCVKLVPEIPDFLYCTLLIYLSNSHKTKGINQLHLLIQIVEICWKNMFS